MGQKLGAQHVSAEINGQRESCQRHGQRQRTASELPCSSDSAIDLCEEDHNRVVPFLAPFGKKRLESTGARSMENISAPSSAIMPPSTPSA